MPEQKMANFCVVQGTLQQKLREGAVEVVLVLKGLRELQHVHQEFVVSKLCNALHSVVPGGGSGRGEVLFSFT